MSKRCFDVFFSLLGFCVLLPIMALIYVTIKTTSKGSALYKQERIGQYGKPFFIYKFRTMIQDADQSGKKITVGKDARITAIGNLLRKTKLDELPQLLNVIKGEMSFVGPRPEVEDYVKFYTEAQRKILNLKPGITDYASIYYRDENLILEKYEDPETIYIQKIMQEKLELNKLYMHNISVWHDFKIIFLTIASLYIKDMKPPENTKLLATKEGE